MAGFNVITEDLDKEQWPMMAAASETWDIAVMRFGDIRSWRQIGNPYRALPAG
jgi:hypothetical protein